MNNQTQDKKGEFTIFQPTLIYNLMHRRFPKVKISGIVLFVKLTQTYMDLLITDGTGEIQCSMYFEAELYKYFQIPKVGQLLCILGAYTRKLVGDKLFSKIKITRYSTGNNLDEYLGFVNKKLQQEEQNQEVQIICTSRKRPTVGKLLIPEARNLVFIAALSVFEHNPEFVHWTFSKDGMKNQSFIKNYLNSKSIPPEQATKAISETIQFFQQKGIICRSQNMFSIYRSIYTKLQEEVLRLVSSKYLLDIDCKSNGINYTYMVELLHKNKLDIQKSSDFVFNVEGLYKIVSKYISQGKIYSHDNKLMWS